MKPDLPSQTMNSVPTPACTAAAQLPVAPARAASNIIPTDALFQGRQEVLISHNGEQYRLRITKNAKLILTK